MKTTKRKDHLINAVLMGAARELTPAQLKWSQMHEEMHSKHHPVLKRGMKNERI